MSSYLRFLSTISADNSSSPYKQLDTKEIQLLEYVLLANSSSKKLLVGDLIQLKKYGSQAVLHSKVKNLVALGYLKLIVNKEDGRKKNVEPTELAIEYESFMSDCLVKAVTR